MNYPGFVPFTGFDPMDGDDPRFTLSRDNPCRVAVEETGERDGKCVSERARFIHHGSANR